MNKSDLTSITKIFNEKMNLNKKKLSKKRTVNDDDADYEEDYEENVDEKDLEEEVGNNNDGEDDENEDDDVQEDDDWQHYSRTGNIKVNEYIDEINMTCLTFSPTSSEKCTNPYTLWLADTNNDVMKINNEKLQQLLTTSPTAYRIISRHSPVGALIPAPNDLT